MLPLAATLGEQARDALLLLYLLLPSTAQAEPVGARMLDGIQVHGTARHAVIEVRFTTAMQYLDHFPRDPGDELRIRLRPAPVSDAARETVHIREALRPDNAAVAHLREVAYEGDMTGGPYLVLEFERAMEFEVLPGPDARGLNVVVIPATPCEPGPEPETPARKKP